MIVKDGDVGRRIMRMLGGLWSISWWTGAGKGVGGIRYLDWCSTLDVFEKVENGVGRRRMRRKTDSVSWSSSRKLNQPRSQVSVLFPNGARSRSSATSCIPAVTLLGLDAMFRQLSGALCLSGEDFFDVLKNARNVYSLLEPGN